MKALQRAFDLFDLANNNEVASEELARIICSIGLDCLPHWTTCICLLQRLIRMQLHACRSMPSFMKYVVPHVRKSFLKQ
jgi:hypothetical protein